MLNYKNEPIYKHTHLSQEAINRVKPLFESAFGENFANFGDKRSQILKEKKDFLAAQYANRVRIAELQGLSPLNEEAQIFGGLGGNVAKLFENVSTPGNIIGMGNVANPDSSSSHNGGTWNPAYKAGSGDIPTYVFGLQAQLALNAIALDLLPTIAVDTPKITLQYVDTVYGGGPMDDVENMPSFLEFSSHIFTAKWVKSMKLKRSVTEIVLAETALDDSKALKIRFILKSTIHAGVTAEVVSTGTVKIDGTYTQTNALSVAEISALLNKSATAQVYVLVDAAYVKTALKTDVSPLRIDYASATRTNISEAATNNNKLTGMSRAQHEKGPKYKLNVIVLDKQTEMVGLEIEADTSNIQIKDMAAMGVNVIARLYDGVQRQIIQTLDEHVLNHIYALGVQHAVDVKRSQDEDFNLYIAAPNVPNKAFADLCPVPFLDMLENDVKADMGTVKNSIPSSSYENQTTHNDRLYARILKVAEFCAQQNRIAPPDFMVLGGAIGAALKKNKTYSVSPTPNTLSNQPELIYSGTVFETINVYKNARTAEFSDPRIVLGRRGNDTDPGAKFLAYDLAASRQTIAERTMAEKIRVWSRFKIEDIGFYPQLNYFTFIAVNDFDWN